MSFKTSFIAATAAALLAGPTLAGDIEVHHAYAISSGGPNGAAFMVIHNNGALDDHLLDVRSNLAARTQLHTHVEEDNGMMRMVHVEEGFDLPSGGELVLQRGGSHVMFMGIATPFEEGRMLELTLVFEGAGEVQIMVEVDNDRVPVDHSTMDHDAIDHSSGQTTADGN